MTRAPGKWTKLLTGWMKRATRAASSAPSVDPGATIERALRQAGLMPSSETPPDDADTASNAAPRHARGDHAHDDGAATRRDDAIDVPFRRVDRVEPRTDATQPIDADEAMGDHFESSEPRPSRARAGFTSKSFANASGARDYKLFVPTGHAHDTLPLIMMLHGCTQDPDDFARGTRMNALAQAHGAIVIYPAQSPQVNPNKCWNWFQRRDQQRDAGEPAILVGMIDETIARHAVDPTRVYVAGLSAGGAMAAILAREYPDRLAAIGVHSGLPAGAAHDVASALAVMRRGAAPREVVAANEPIVPTIVFHGDRDHTVNPANGELVLPRVAGQTETREDDGLPGKRYTRRVFTRPDGRVIGEHWLLHGIGHAWSGGSPDGNHTDVLGPDASAEMLRFFLAHSRAAA